jgi:predicted nucleic acid-binding protein
LIIVDTSGVFAATDPRQVFHEPAKRILLRPERRILSPFVLAELDYLLATRTGDQYALKLLADVAGGAYELHPFTARDIAAAIQVMERYRDLSLGLADASVIVLAHVYGCPDILTLDERHFRAVSGPHGEPFRLLPRDEV